MEDNLLPNAKLLSLLDKMVNPIGDIEIGLKVNGIFAIPEEWKLPDNQNPQDSILSYKISYQGADVEAGLYQQRMLTEEEKKAIEEAAAAKQKKKEKKGKGDDAPQLTPEELEQQKKLEEEKAEAKRLAELEWEQLTEEEKFYRTYEDPYKHPRITFQNNESSTKKEGEDIVVFEENVEIGGEWIYITRFPNLPEDKIAQMKKQKPKGLNPLDLNNVLMKAWVDLSDFQIPGTTHVVKRCKLEQYYLPDQKPEELPKPNLENTYVLVEINLAPAITPLVKEVQPKADDLIPKPQPIPKLPSSVEVINEFKGQLIVAMESLAMEYTTFAKEMNSQSEAKGKLLTAQQIKKARDERKDKFLYDFNMSGKYNILKEKMKKSIMKIVRDKFQKQGSLTGVTTDSKDQFYSELYMFLIEQMRQTLNDHVQTKKDELHEDLVVSMEQANQERDKVITTLTKESESDKQLRLATENEIINNLSDAEKAFKNLLNVDKKNSKNWYFYSLYLLRRKNFPKAEESLLEALTYDRLNTDYILLLACLQARRNRKKEPIVCLNTVLEKNYADPFANSLMSFIYSNVLSDQKLGRKYFSVSQRILLRKLNMLPQKPTTRRSDPPEGGEAFNYRDAQQAAEENMNNRIQLTPEQVDDIWIELIEYLLKYELHDFAEKVMSNLNDKESNRVKYFNAQILYMKGQLDEAIEILDQMLNENPKNTEYLLTKANYCFVADKFYEAEETFLKAFKLKGNVKTFPTYLRLGYIFLARKAWGDARAVLAKSCEMKPNSSISWLGLGIACLRTGEFSEGEQALNQANLYDPLNSEIWGYLALLCLTDGGRVVQAHQAIREMLKCEIKNNTLLEELADKLNNISKNEDAKTLYKKILENYQANNVPISSNPGDIYCKIGKLYHNEDNLKEARRFYSEALNYLENESEKERIEYILSEIRNAIELAAINGN